MLLTYAPAWWYYSSWGQRWVAFLAAGEFQEWDSRCRGEQKTPAQLYVTEQQLQFYTRPIWEQRFISTRVENMSDLFFLNVCFCRSQSCDLSRSAEVCWLLSVSQDQVRCGLSSKARTPSLTYKNPKGIINSIVFVIAEFGRLYRTRFRCFSSSFAECLSARHVTQKRSRLWLSSTFPKPSYPDSTRRSWPSLCPSRAWTRSQVRFTGTSVGHI